MRVRNPSLMMRWMRAFATASSTTTALVKIAAAAASGGGQPPNTTGRDAYRRPDGTAVIPAALLGP